jgi:hypothetical protein
MALRVGTLNVHRWADARNSGNFERIASLLLPLSLDIVVLQEAGPFTRKPTGGPELAARLGLAHVRVTGDVVLLSRFPLNDRMPLGRQNKRLLLVDVALPMYGSAHSNAFSIVVFPKPFSAWTTVTLRSLRSASSSSCLPLNCRKFWITSRYKIISRPS